jgi:hypothetical protein
MPFVEVAAGMREAIRVILNHSFSPHLASTGRFTLPRRRRSLGVAYSCNHIYVPASFGERGVDEYQEIDETGAHWTNIETLRNHCKVYGTSPSRV